ncbi:hypothetical protein CU102_12270 [Phyllobacterium brassicacearum]|uniref:DUF4145 domain-containing protein n=1 Tax=Phyllobacterium brassicacearum TaxID=314235 RepID=A0A2P7BQF8_9HYPH|nr:DUF4145 domain-containing protein [Phyllobacterium brassicacearum]PSH68718.1 hypothetical protein CU102_12270 [Phyllobacterium brassicacearum]TDQ19877.1 uncharacterized protein DUF4145 [Phyllobacterium brassicacearum]
MNAFDWTCPHCGRSQIVETRTYDSRRSHLDIGDTAHGMLGLDWTAIRCTNHQCKEVTLSAQLIRIKRGPNSDHIRLGHPIETWLLRPTSNAKPQPDYIPQVLRLDYVEACLIKDLSPKASATLSRRCLQGMIRDFCGIAKGNLNDEISALRKLVEADQAPRGVEAETMEAIDAVRQIGNIGAHMEKDISLIVEVEPNEAQAMIELIEMLFDEWYVSQHERQLKLERVKSIANAKQAVKKGQKNEGAIPVPDDLSGTD